MKKYIVGIDFGNGETSAWFIPIDENDPNVIEEGSVRLALTSEPQKRKIKTTVNLTKNGHYSTTEPGAVIIGLKAKISSLSERRRTAYKAFIKDVYKRVINNNPHLIDKRTGNTDFYLCIASPTKWNEEEQQEYINFFNSALAEYNQEILWVINESDAAYFAHRNDKKNILVIDFGSSTIDYTLICNGIKKSDDSWSNDYLGAREVERAMLQSYRNTSPSFQNILHSVEQLLRSTGNDFFDVKETLEFEFRKAKENGFASYVAENQRKPYDYKLNFDFYEATQEIAFEEYEFKHRGFFRGENGVCEPYIKQVVEDFKALKDKISNCQDCDSVDSIILSGGACNMSWVAEEVRKVFGVNTQIILDPDPEYVVSKGIARYAKAQIKALSDLRNKIQELNFETIYIDADKDATLLATNDLFPSVLKDIEGDNDYTGNQIWEKVANFFYGLNSSNYDYCHILKKCINETLTSTIAKNLSNCIKEVFSKEVNTNNVNIFIEAEIMNFSVEFFNEGPGGQKIYDVLAKATGPHVFTDYNPEKTRSKSERNAIVQLLRQTFFVRDPFGVSYKEDDLKRIASEIKRQSLLEAEKLFYSEQLFKTTFKK